MDDTNGGNNMAGSQVVLGIDSSDAKDGSLPIKRGNRYFLAC